MEVIKLQLKITQESKSERAWQARGVYTRSGGQAPAGSMGRENHGQRIRGCTFYRATLCVSAVFAVARPSVCPSRWCIVSRWLKISSNFFFSPVASSFWFFDRRCRYPIPRGTRSAGAQNTRGWEIFAIFDRNRRLSRKRYDIGPWLL